MVLFQQLGTVTEIHAFGGRSFTIWNEMGEIVFDSGSQIANVTAVLAPDLFNGQDGSFDNRSDDKGAEPEGVTKATVAGRTYAFVGLERISGIMVYDVTDPQHPLFVQYQPAEGSDISPEGLLFIPAHESPNGRNLLIVSYEVSGNTSIFTFGPAMNRAYLPVVATE